MGKLTVRQSERLIELCGIVRRGMQTFVEMGAALREIRDSGLYTEHAENFEEFVAAEFGFSRPRAYQLIAAAGVVEEMSTQVDILPTSERQVRALLDAPPEHRAEAWKDAQTEGGEQPKPAAVRKAADKYVPMSERLARAEKRKAKPVSRVKQMEIDRIAAAEEAERAAAERARLAAQQKPPVVAPAGSGERWTPGQSSEAEEESGSVQDRSKSDASDIGLEDPATVGVSQSGDPVLPPEPLTAAVRVEGARLVWLDGALPLSGRHAPLTEAQALAYTADDGHALYTLGLELQQAGKRIQIVHEKHAKQSEAA